MLEGCVAIIGAGPAGLAAGVQLTRYGVCCSVFERSRVGGLLHNANLVENYLGFPGGIPGDQLARLFEQQAQKLGVDVILEEVLWLSYEENCFRLKTCEHEYHPSIVVLATGTKPKPLPLIIPSSLEDKVLYEILPIRHVRSRRFAIVGAGDLAFDYALNLSRNNQVLILNRSDRTKCLSLLFERAMQSGRITYRDNIQVTGLQRDAQDRLQLECLTPQGDELLQVDYLIGAIGREPQLDFLSPEIQDSAPALEKAGVLYFAGDVRGGLFRQASIAAGEGIRVAMRIYSYMNEVLK